jgi:hypothetical protein
MCGKMVMFRKIFSFHSRHIHRRIQVKFHRLRNLATLERIRLKTPKNIITNKNE